MALPIDQGNYVPVGSEMRVLLNSDRISYGDIHTTLKKKGIYIGNSDKSVTVPLLSATILTPTEFVQLIEDSVDREQRPKTKISEIPLSSSTSDWILPIRNEFSTINVNACDRMGNIELIKPPALVIEGRDKVRVPYSITRRDISKDWIEREVNFSGEITIEKSGNSLRLEISSVHSSKETDVINRELLRKLSGILKKEGVTTVEEPRKITFGAFSHIERLRFFKRLAGGNQKNLKIGNVNDIEVARDGITTALPNDPAISWMSDAVRRLKIDGERLNEVFLIADEVYYQYYYVPRMDVTYPFVNGANSGFIRVSFSFGFSRTDEKKDSCELSSEIVSVKYDNPANLDAKKDVFVALGRAIRELIDQEYNKIAMERNSSNLGST